VAPATLSVTLKGYKGSVQSSQELGAELTEAVWLATREAEVIFHTPGMGDPFVALDLLPELGLSVTYGSGTAQQREVLRMMIERVLPAEGSDPARHRRWVGLLVGLGYVGTLALGSSRVPRIPGIHTHLTTVELVGLWVLGAALGLVGGVAATRLIYWRWFPALERLPDSGKTRWDRRRSWVQLGLGIWATVVAGLLALPPT